MATLRSAGVSRDKRLDVVTLTRWLNRERVSIVESCDFGSRVFDSVRISS